MPFERNLIEIDPKSLFADLDPQAAVALKLLIEKFMKNPGEIYCKEEDDDDGFSLTENTLKLKRYNDKAKQKIEYYVKDNSDNTYRVRLIRPIKKQKKDETTVCWAVGKVLGAGASGKVKEADPQYVLNAGGEVEQIPSKIVIKTSNPSEKRELAKRKIKLKTEVEISKKYLDGGEEIASFQARFVKDNRLLRTELFMPQIEGRSLGALLRDGTIGEMSYAQRLKLMHAIAKTLADFQKKTRYVHRDVKPVNIIVNLENWTAILVDFEFSKKQGESLKSKSGSPLYMSPERFFSISAKNEFSVDYYSLMLTFAEILLAKPVLNLDLDEKAQEQEYWKGIKNFYGSLFDVDGKRIIDADYDYAWLEKQLAAQQRELIPLLKRLTKVQPYERITEKELIQELNDLSLLRNFEVALDLCMSEDVIQVFKNRAEKIIKDTANNKAALRRCIQLAVTNDSGACSALESLLSVAPRAKNKAAWEFIKEMMVEVVRGDTNIQSLDAAYMNLLEWSFAENGDTNSANRVVNYIGTLWSRFSKSKSYSGEVKGILLERNLKNKQESPPLENGQRSPSKENGEKPYNIKCLI